DNAVGQVDANGFRRRDGLAGEHQFHRGPHAAEPHGAYRAAEARVDAELYLGQAEYRLRVLQHDAIVAREGELESAAERIAVDRRHGRATQRRQAVEHLLAET